MIDYNYKLEGSLNILQHPGHVVTVLTARHWRPGAELPELECQHAQPGEPLSLDANGRLFLGDIALRQGTGRSGASGQGVARLQLVLEASGLVSSPPPPISIAAAQRLRQTPAGEAGMHACLVLVRVAIIFWSRLHICPQPHAFLLS